MTSFLTSTDSNLDKQVLNAEVMVTNFLVQLNIALLFKEAFPDSKIAKKYASRRTKSTVIMNKSFAGHCLDYIVEHCKFHP